jgi:hypothetical protein
MVDKTINILDKYFENINPSYQAISKWQNITQENFDNWQERSIIDSFVFNFIKIQNMMDDKLHLTKYEA